MDRTILGGFEMWLGPTEPSPAVLLFGYSPLNRADEAPAGRTREAVLKTRKVRPPAYEPTREVTPGRCCAAIGAMALTVGGSILDAFSGCLFMLFRYLVPAST